MVARTKKTPAQATPDPKKFVCDEEGCKYVGGSKSVITRHWNNVHRKPHAQKRGTRKRNQDQGAPTVLTPKVIADLVAAFQNGLTKKQAFKYAGISKDAYYDGIKRDEDFADKMHAAQWHLNMKAREVVANSIVQHKDVRTAQWYLERKEKDEFSLRRETTGSGGGPIKTKDVGAPEVTITKEELREALFGK